MPAVTVSAVSPTRQRHASLYRHVRLIGAVCIESDRTLMRVPDRGRLVISSLWHLGDAIQRTNCAYDAYSSQNVPDRPVRFARGHRSHYRSLPDKRRRTGHASRTVERRAPLGHQTCDLVREQRLVFTCRRLSSTMLIAARASAKFSMLARGSVLAPGPANIFLKTVTPRPKTTLRDID